MEKLLKPQYSLLYHQGLLKDHTTHIGISQLVIAENERQCKNLAKLVDAMCHLNAQLDLTGRANREDFHKRVDYVKNEGLVTSKFAMFYKNLEDLSGAYKRMFRDAHFATLYVPQNCGVNFQIDGGSPTLGFSTPVEKGVVKRTSKYDRFPVEFLSSFSGLTNIKWVRGMVLEQVDQGAHTQFLASEWVNVRGIHLSLEREVLETPILFAQWQQDMVSSNVEDRRRALQHVKLTLKIGTYLHNNRIVPCFQPNKTLEQEIFSKYQHMSKTVKDKLITFQNWFKLFVDRWCISRADMIKARDTEESYESVGRVNSADASRAAKYPNRVESPNKNPYRLIAGYIEKAKTKLLNGSFSIREFNSTDKARATVDFLYESIYKNFNKAYNNLNDATNKAIRSELQEYIEDCSEAVKSLKTLYGEFSDDIDFAFTNKYANLRALI